MVSSTYENDDGPRASIVKLNEDNYNDWLFEFENALTLRGWESTLLLVNPARVGATTRAAGTAEEIAAASVEAASLAAMHKKGLALMGNRVDRMYYADVKGAKTVYEAIAALEKRHLGTVSIRRGDLQRQLFDLRKASDESADAYLVRAQRLRDDLKSVGEATSDKAMITAVLRGLPAGYKSVVEFLQMMDISTVEAIKLPICHKEQLLKEEDSALERGSTMGNVAFSAVAANSRDQRKCFRCGDIGHVAPNCSNDKGAVKMLNKKLERLTAELAECRGQDSKSKRVTF